MEMNLTVELSDEVASELPRSEDDLADILELGLREWKCRGAGEFGGLTGILEKLAEQPPPEEILALRPAPELQARVSQLLEKNRRGVLSAEDELELQQHEFVEHLVR